MEKGEKRKEEKKLEHCWTLHKKKIKKRTFLGKIDSA